MKGRKRHKVHFMFAAAIGASPFLGPLSHAGTTLQWDPNPAPGIQGGFGIWNSSNTNWDNAGVASVWFNTQSNTAIFGGTAGGVVQMPAAINAASIQFDTAGYVIGATPPAVLTLNSGSVQANADATIAALLSTPAGLNKSGPGTLTLTGQGTIRGNLTVLQGLLAFSSDAQLGGASNDIELAGGGLRYAGNASATLAAGHALIVDAVGGRIETPAAKLLLSTANQITGAGTLAKFGAQPLQINAANVNFTGTLDIGEGPVWLQDAKAINGRPITLSAGVLALRADQPTNFQSALTVSANGTVTVDHIAAAGMTGQSHALGDLAINSGATLTVTSSSRNFLSVKNLSLAGTLRLNDSAAMVTGTFSGGGAITFGPSAQAPAAFTTGLIFANGAAQTIANSLSPDAGATGPVLGVGAATTLTYNGQWAGGAASAQSAVVLRDGGKFVAGPAAHLNTTTPDRIGIRPLIVIGNGLSNTFELGASFVADHTAAGSLADGFSSLEIRDATFLSHATTSLPVILKQDASGVMQRAGNLIFSGTIGASWIVANAAQQYDGGIIFNSSATIQTDHSLTHSGNASDRFDGSFQIPLPGATLTKQGAGNLILAGDQGYAPGAGMKVTAGTVRFDTDPAAGWYAGNYSRGADGKIDAEPVPAATLALNIGGGSSSAAVLFTPALSRVDSIQISSNGSATIATAPHPGEKTVLTHSLALTGNGYFDLRNGRLIVDYSTSSPLPAIATLIKNGAIFSSAATDPSMTIGYAEAASLLHLSQDQSTTLAGQTIDATSIVIMPTRIGDANLDGRVTFVDFQRLEAGFGLPNQSWSGGDFNFDGVVNQADLKLLYENYGKSADFNLAPASPVPEPSTLPLFGGILVLLRRVRRCPFATKNPFNR